jgi:aspergillopepsin I
VVPLNFQSIADTGTTLLLLPPKAVKDFYAQVQGAQLIATEGGYVYPCNSALPDLTVMMGDIKAKVPSRFLSRGLSMTGSGKCFGGLQQGSEQLSIWGDIFLKSQFVVFDGRDPPRIGFAPQSPEAVNSNGNPPKLVANSLTTKSET